ncbi:hypothetical protein [Cupriavidus metallidurans]|uniref:hypothetical protein n=1 Tax=Cupriavidus metallidurans TaxID=119219 RepID=UPI001CCECABA|nr:hypothetical protein [Cupriavidus metallidurans]UBM12781.1 hypothetical protein LAI70_27905 [Cupriavidus metallidurans]
MIEMKCRATALFDEIERVCPEILPENARAIPPMAIAEVLRADLKKRLALSDGFGLRLPFGAFCDVLMRRLHSMPNAVEEEQPNPEIVRRRPKTKRCGDQAQL